MHYRAVGLPILVSLFLSTGCGAADETDAPAADSLQAAESATATTAPSPDEALRPLFAAVEADPNDLQARQALGRALHDANRKEEAVAHFEKAVELQRSERTLLDLGIAYAAASRFAEAEQTYRELLELAPNYPLALHNMGNIAYKRGNDERAVDYYHRAIAADPGYMLAYYHLGQALTRLERYREAYRSFENVLKIEPTDGQQLTVFDDALYQLAALDIKMGANERAAELLAELIRENPTHEKAYYAYGQVLLQLGRIDEAQQALAKHAELQRNLKSTDTVAAPE